VIKLTKLASLVKYCDILLIKSQSKQKQYKNLANRNDQAGLTSLVAGTYVHNDDKEPSWVVFLLAMIGLAIAVCIKKKKPRTY